MNDWFHLLSLSSWVSGFFFSSSGLKIKQINNYLWHQLKNMSKGKQLYTLNTTFLSENSGFHPKEAHLYHWIWPQVWSAFDTKPDESSVKSNQSIWLLLHQPAGTVGQVHLGCTTSSLKRTERCILFKSERKCNDSNDQTDTNKNWKSAITQCNPM